MFCRIEGKRNDLIIVYRDNSDYANDYKGVREKEKCIKGGCSVLAEKCYNQNNKKF